MRKQRGVTAIGWVFLLIPMALTLYALLRVGPVYLNYWRVVDSMKKTASQLKGDETLTPLGIRTALDKRFDVGYVDKITPQDITVRKGAEGWEMVADYEGEAPLFSNVKIIIAFDTTVVIK